MSIVLTTSGKVRGARSGNALAYKGIPYAAAPVGEQRFRLPAPAPSWEGERDATAYGPTAPQPPAELIKLVFPGLDVSPMMSGWTPGDEFLNLNVWTPDPGAAGLPVMVFIHGGAFLGGAGSTPLYDGTSFAERGVVLVTLNYRLGIEGFLPIPGIARNLGLQDQLAALRWVQDNIAAFGGDPAKVTVFGESAGATSIIHHLAFVAGEGLFRRAIVQSGPAVAADPAYGTRIAEYLAGQLGVPATRDGFASKEEQEVLQAQLMLAAAPRVVDLNELPDGADALHMITQYWPCVDGEYVTGQPLTAIAAGSGAGVELLAGTNTDEMNFWQVPTNAVGNTDEARMAKTAARLHPDPDALIGAYRAMYPDKSPGELVSAMATDRSFRLQTLGVADAHGGPTYAYEFTWRSPALGDRLGAAHSIELPFVFNTLGAGTLTGPEGLLGPNPPAELAERVHQAWIDFATTGNPGWDQYTVDSRKVMRIGDDWSLADDPARGARHAWGSAAVPRG